MGVECKVQQDAGRFVRYVEDWEAHETVCEGVCKAVRTTVRVCQAACVCVCVCVCKAVRNIRQRVCV